MDQHFNKFDDQKKLLLRELESVGDPLKKVELLGLLESVISRLGSLLMGEHKWKAKWKRKQADILFNKNSCLASKRVLSPIMSSYLQIKKLWISTSHLLYLILSIHPLDGLPPAPPISNFFHHKISLSVNLKKYSTHNEMALLLEST